jgi:hypothetical protein
MNGLPFREINPGRRTIEEVLTEDWVGQFGRRGTRRNDHRLVLMRGGGGMGLDGIVRVRVRGRF